MPEVENATNKNPRFPGINLDYAIKVINEARKFGRNVSSSHIAGKLSPKSGAFLRKKASLGYFGLITGRGDNLTITDLAEKIIYPKNEIEKATSIKEAFLMPEIFSNLYKTLEKNNVISLQTLGNVVLRQYKMTENGKNQFLSIFVNSGIFSGLIQYSDKANNEIILIPDSPKEDMQVEFVPETNNRLLENLQSTELNLSKGKAIITVPAELSVEDVKKLKLQIDIFASILSDS